MGNVHLSDDDMPEKAQIADQYLVPKAIRVSGLLVVFELLLLYAAFFPLCK